MWVQANRARTGWRRDTDWNDETVGVRRNRTSFHGLLILLRFELGKFFLGASDVGFLSDPELKELLLSA